MVFLDISKVFDKVLPGTFSTEALYLYNEIFVFVKSVGNLQNLHQNYKRLLPKLHTRTTLETAKHFFSFTVSLSSSDVLSFYCNILINFVFCWSMCNLPKLA